MSEIYQELPETALDAIMVANQQWPALKERRPDAINTTIGVLLDSTVGKPWQPTMIAKAREDVLSGINQSGEYGYQTQAGDKAYLQGLADLALGREGAVAHGPDLLGYQALGGTGALSLTKDVLLDLVKPYPSDRYQTFLDPGWPNHLAIFNKPFDVVSYSHLDKARKYDHQSAIESLESMPDGSIMLLQACGYNDDGVDRTHAQWDEILDLAISRDNPVIMDSAYLGLADGIETDRYPIEQSIKRGLLTFVGLSTSKNMGLYNERLGALYIANTELRLGIQQAKNLDQLVKRIIRRTYSNPPLLAAKSVGAVLARDGGQADYLAELESARQKLTENRRILGEQLEDYFPELINGRGLFTKLLAGGYTERQQEYLLDKGVLVLPNSRMNIGGIKKSDIERVGEAVLGAVRLNK